MTQEKREMADLEGVEEELRAPALPGESAMLSHAQCQALLSALAGMRRERERMREALGAIAGFGEVNLAGEWEPSLRDIIRSCVDCARAALNAHRAGNKT